jgi:hypothetical protein
MGVRQSLVRAFLKLNIFARTPVSTNNEAVEDLLNLTEYHRDLLDTGEERISVNSDFLVDVYSPTQICESRGFIGLIEEKKDE